MALQVAPTTPIDIDYFLSNLENFVNRNFHFKAIALYNKIDGVN